MEERTGFGSLSPHPPPNQAPRPYAHLSLASWLPSPHHQQDPWPLPSYWFGAMGDKMMSVWQERYTKPKLRDVH